MGPTKATKNLRSTLMRVVASMVYAVILSTLSAWALDYLSQGGGQDLFGGFKGDGGGSHEKSVRALVTRPTGHTLDAVGGLAGVKEQLRQAVLLPLRHPAIFYGGAPSVRPSAGVLMHGPPGTGKTMLARAVASEAGVPLMSLSAAALESKWWGESPKLLEAAFRVARTDLAPCIVFFDEIDGLGRARSDQDQSCVYSFKCELLRNLDGIVQSTAPVSVIACTNCPSSLDPALRRRFGRCVSVELPDEAARLDILRKAVADETIVDEDALRSIARRTTGMSGSGLAALYTEASYHRMQRDATVEARIDDGRIATADDLVRQLGPLTVVDWEASGRLPTTEIDEEEEAPPCHVSDITHGKPDLTRATPERANAEPKSPERANAELKSPERANAEPKSPERANAETCRALPSTRGGARARAATRRT